MGLSVSPTETLLSSQLVEYCQDLQTAIYEGEMEMSDLMKYSPSVVKIVAWYFRLLYVTFLQHFRKCDCIARC